MGQWQTVITYDVANPAVLNDTLWMNNMRQQAGGIALQRYRTQMLFPSGNYQVTNIEQVYDANRHKLQYRVTVSF